MFTQFFNWIRAGVAQAVLDGLADAADAMENVQEQELDETRLLPFMDSNGEATPRKRTAKRKASSSNSK